MEQHNAHPSDAQAFTLSVFLTPAIKRMSIVKTFMRIACERQIKIVMRHATFISTFRGSHLRSPSRVYDLVKAKACDRRLQKHHRQTQDIGRHRGKAAMNVRC
jgi:hypothetical protein